MFRTRSFAGFVFVSVFTLTAFGISGGVSSGPVLPQDTADDDETREFMHSKLSMAHKIVDGLAMDDFALIEAGATELANLADLAAWKRPDDRSYQYYSGAFEQAARRLIDASQSRSLEQSTYAWVHLQFSCTACHQHVRRVDRVAFDR